MVVIIGARVGEEKKLDVPVLRVIRVREQVHGGLADAVLSGALGAGVSTYVVPCLSK